MRRHLTYANLAATLALMLSLAGGIAVAGGQLGPHTVGTKQLKNDAVTAKKVKDGSLLAADFGTGQLPAGPEGAPGPTGATGSAGASGATGPVGPRGADAASYVGEAPLPISLAVDSCTGFTVFTSAFRVGDTGVVGFDYAGGTAPLTVTIAPGTVTTAGQFPFSVCNHGSATATSAGAIAHFWRVAGPAARPAAAATPLTVVVD